MSTIKEKLKAVQTAVSAIEKQFGKGAIMSLGGEAEDIAVIPTGSVGLDLALGVGGLPRGRVVEIYGPESSGKTTLTLHAIAQAQKAGGVCAFIDAEHALDVTYARKLGVRIEDLLVSQPDHGEQALEIADKLVGTGAIDLIIVDSVAALVPKAEIEGEMGDSHMGLQARLMSQALRKLTAATCRNNTCVVFINQMPTLASGQEGAILLQGRRLSQSLSLQAEPHAHRFQEPTCARSPPASQRPHLLSFPAAWLR
jgi:recombination protein RecA